LLRNVTPAASGDSCVIRPGMESSDLVFFGLVNANR
jgi:hypothetical protein